MGKVKAAICEMDPNGAGLHIDVDYKTCVVRHRREVVAKFNGEELALAGVAQKFKGARLAWPFAQVV